MTVSSMKITSITPRGGPTGTTVTVSGVGFGIVPGVITFDPLGVAIQATSTTWIDDSIVFTVPAGLPQNRSLIILFANANGIDSATSPFWIPAPSPTSDQLDYQFPELEASGSLVDETDDPFEIEAKDINRLIDRIKATTGGDMRKSVYDVLNRGFVDKAGALDDAGVPRDINYIRALIAASMLTPRLDAWPSNTNPPPTAGQTDFTLSATPTTTFMIVFVNGIGYFGTGQWVLIGSSLVRWLDVDFAIETADSFAVLYF